MTFSRFFRRPTESVVEPVPGGTVLAPLDRAQAVRVDADGSLRAVDAPADASPLTWSVRTGDGWFPAADGPVEQTLDGAAVLTRLRLADGSVAHRVAVGIVGGTPSAIVEVTNDTDYAVAVGFDFGAGSTFHAGSQVLRAAAGTAALVTGGQPAVDPGDPVSVVALPHTATTRVAVPLGEATATVLDATAAVPAVADISRGWERHLERAFRVVTGESSIDEAQAPLQRALLTLEPPEPGSSAVAPWIAALSEAGFASEADGELWRLERSQPLPLIYAVGRWAELGGTAEALEGILEPFARAVHVAAKASAPLEAPMGWSQGAVAGAMRVARAIDQPDIADRLAAVGSRAVRSAPVPTRSDVARFLHDASDTWSWPESWSGAAPAAALRNIRHLVVDESEPGVDLLPALSPAWRGKPIEAHRLTTGAGTLSWGIRWHGARPALLWELNRSTDAYFRIRCTSVSEEWESIEESGETLLPDPGWEQV